MSETLTETPRPALAVTREPFGRMPDGTMIWRYRMTNRCRMTVELVTYGARIHAIHVPDMHGNSEDISLGFDSLDGYLGENDAYFGATIGRYANRIGGARVDVNGTAHELSANEGANTLHGGHNGFDSCVWASESFDAGSTVGVEMTYFSPDGEMGFPGNLAVTVRYTLDDANRLRLHYSAVCDRATPVNLTNHVYFNLAGAGMPSVLEHVATLNASRFTPVDKTMIPTGGLESVANTPLDFMRPRRIGDAIDDDHEQLIRAGGYDTPILFLTGLTAPVFEERALAAVEVFKEKLVKRSISMKAFEAGEPAISGKVYKVNGKILQGIEQDKAKEISKAIRDEKFKGVQAQVQGDQLRVTGKKKDDLQAVIALLKSKDFGIALQFTNYR